MPIRLKLSGLAETIIESISCPNCGYDGGENMECSFSTELSKVTTVGIVGVAICPLCQQIFVPSDQNIGIVNQEQLTKALREECGGKGVKPMESIDDVILYAESQGAWQRGEIH